MGLQDQLNTSPWRTQRLPVILQSEVAECGLACLSMIASYFGHQIDVAGMRRRFSVSLKGVTLKGLMSIASGLGLHGRPVKLELESLGGLRLPCVLHWDFTHFVVLKRVSSNQIVIHDPAVGERRLSMLEAGKHFTGVAVEFSPTSEFKPQTKRREYTLLSLLGKVVGLKKVFAQILILGLALQICSLIGPFYLQWVVDEALLTADRDLVTVLGVGFLLLVMLQTLIGATRSWVTTVLSTSVNFQWLGNAFTHLLRLPLPFFEKRHTGDIVSRFGSIQTIQRSLTTQFAEGVIDGVLVLGTLAMMLIYSTKLTIVSIVAVLLYLGLRWSIYKSLQEATVEQIIHAARQQTHFMESVRGMQSLRLFGREGERRSGWMNALVEQFNADLRIARLSVSYQTANTFLFSVERVVVIWLAALAVIDNQLSVGMLFAFVSYKDQFSQRIVSLVDKLFDLRMLRLHGDRVAEIVMTPTESNNSQAEVDIGLVVPSVEIRDLSFRYSDGEPYIFENLNLTIPAGQCIAITGPSGCGKTTFVKLLLGLLEPTSGEILIGGFRLGQLGLQNYRKLLGTVMQDDVLFAGSIADNICFFDPSPDQDRIEECARLAAIHRDIVAMPMAFNTLVGDIGTGLSGGQKQRILLARALYKNPKMLVLDEATSHLDVRNEQAVNAAIKDSARTRIIVAHRPDTIAMAQRVVVLLNGAVMQDVLQERPQLREDSLVACV